MKLILTFKKESDELKTIVVPMITLITALRNAIDTDSDMVENPAIFEDDKIIMEMFWGNKVSEEQENNFKNRTLNALRFIFSEAGIENYEIKWF